MEDPATWGEAEHIVRRVLEGHYDNMTLALTAPDKVIVGLSLERQITGALRAVGLLDDTLRPRLRKLRAKWISQARHPQRMNRPDERKMLEKHAAELTAELIRDAPAV